MDQGTRISIDDNKFSTNYNSIYRYKLSNSQYDRWTWRDCYWEYPSNML